MSTEMVRFNIGSNSKSPVIASELPSNAIPSNSPFPFNTGLPLFPPVISLSVKKATGISPLYA